MLTASQPRRLDRVGDWSNAGVIAIEPSRRPGALFLLIDLVEGSQRFVTAEDIDLRLLRDLAPAVRRCLREGEAPLRVDAAGGRLVVAARIAGGECAVRLRLEESGGLVLAELWLCGTAGEVARRTWRDACRSRDEEYTGTGLVKIVDHRPEASGLDAAVPAVVPWCAVLLARRGTVWLSEHPEALERIDRIVPCVAELWFSVVQPVRGRSDRDRDRQLADLPVL